MTMTAEKKVGIFFLITLIVLGIMIELAEDWHPFEKRREYKAYFDSAVGIKLGDPVRMAGVEVGKIRNIGIEDSKVRIDFDVSNGTVLRKDSTAEIQQTNLLGGQFLGISFGSADAAVLEPGSSVETLERATVDQLITNLDRNQNRVFGQIGDLVEESRDSIVNAVSKLDNVMRKIDGGEGTIGLLVNDPGLYHDVQGAVVDLKAVMNRMEQGEGTIGRLMTDSTLYDDAVVTVGDLKEIVAQVRRGEGTLGRLVVEDTLYVNASDTFANLREVSAKANQGTGTLGRLVNDDALYDEAYAALEKVNSIASKIDKGEGTLGRLVNEDTLYRDAATTLHKVEKAVDGVSDSGPLSALGVVVGTMF